MSAFKITWKQAALGGIVVAAVGGVSLAAVSRPAAALPEVTVYKGPACGCCDRWIEHLEAGGFTVKAVDVDDVTPMRIHHGVPAELGSCHTAMVGGYIVEGHVPADVIQRLLEERPAVIGIAVPGMPIGSPGMEQEGSPAERYDVLTFDRAGKTTVFVSR